MDESQNKNINITAEPKEVFAGQTVKLTLKNVEGENPVLKFFPPIKDGSDAKHGYSSIPSKNDEGLYVARWDTTGIPPTWYDIEIHFADGRVVTSDSDTTITVKQALTNTVISKSHAPQPTDDQALWAAIRNRTQAIGFDRYTTFIDNVFCNGSYSNSRAIASTRRNVAQNNSTSQTPPSNKTSECGDIQWKSKLQKEIADLRINAADSYSVLRLATQVFLLLESGVHLENPNELNKLFEEDKERIRLQDPGATFMIVSAKLEQYLDGTQGKLPYLHRVLEALLGPYNNDTWAEKLAYCNRILQYRFSCPSMLELIWSYWHEEAMLVQSMNAMTLRFQNRRGAGKRDPLAHLEIDPLHGLNNLLWAQIQNEYNRLSLTRRSYEYDHHYGISLHGKAVPALRSADTRSKFLEGFHTVLNRAADFYRQNANTQVNADAFPLLNAIKRVHLCLAEGAHNQFGDLPWTARVEMMIEQWILARPEMGEFLHQRAMVPYREPWMGRVDAMKTLQGWTDTPVTHFNELAVFGEQLVLSLRYGDWVDVNDENQARNWALYWKPEVQSYINAYQVATGIDLSAKLRDGKQVDSTPPSKHLLRKLQQQQRRALAA